MKGEFLIIGTIVAVCLVIGIVLLSIINRRMAKKLKKQIEDLDREKNEIASTPVMSELAKVETLVKNDKLEEKYREWQKRYENIKNIRLDRINDMIIDLDLYVDNKDKRTLKVKIAKTEIEIYKARVAANNLLHEVKEITVSEEKYRSIITKLKAKYRTLSKTFDMHKEEYRDVEGPISLQFENIEKRFAQFEQLMEENDYSEVVHIVKALDSMIDHMGILINEVPDIVLMAEELIPHRIEEINKTYEDMSNEGYQLDYLNIPYNTSEAEKNISTIMDRVKVLNLEDSMFELKTMLDYLDSLFNDFEKEKLSRKMYEDNVDSFERKLESVNKNFENVYSQMPDIRNMYDLHEEDVKEIEDLKERLYAINVNYKELKDGVIDSKIPYSKSSRELETITNLLTNIEDDLDKSLHSLGSMHDDEERAKEQRVELTNLLKEASNIIKSYKLPVVDQKYYIQLEEAEDAILEIDKELELSPIVIKTLNLRVDNARDLSLKVFSSANNMVKCASMCESAIVYGNRYREDIDKELTRGEELFYQGDYKLALNTVVNAINTVEPGFLERINQYRSE